MNFKERLDTITFSSPFRTGVIIAVILLLLIAGITYRQISNLQRSADQVTLSFEVEQEINKLFSGFNLMEASGFRSLIVNDSAYQPNLNYYKSRSEISLARLRTITKPEQKANLESVVKYKELLYQNLNDIHDVLDPENLNNPALRQKLKENEMIMAELRDLRELMIEIKEDILADRLNDYQSQSLLTHLTSLMLAIFSLIVFVIFFRIINDDRLRIMRTEQFMQDILQNTDNIINYYEPIYNEAGEINDMKVVFANEMNRKYLGHDPKSLEGKRVSEVFPFLLLNGELDKLIQGFRQNKIFRLDRQINVNGRKMWFESVIKPMDNGLLIVATNKTEEKNAEEALRSLNEELRQQNEELEDTRRLKKVVLQSTDSLVNHYEAIRGADGEIEDFRILYSTENIYKYFGKTRDEVMGQTLSEVYPYLDILGLPGLLKKCITTGKKHTMEKMLRLEQGETWLAITLQPLGDRITSTTVNITELKEAQNRLLSANEQLTIQNSILTNAEGMAGIGSFIWHIHNDSLAISDNFYRLLGYEPGSFEPSFYGFLQRVHPEDRKHLNEEIENVLAEEVDVELTYRLLTKKGKIRHMHTLAHFLKENGVPVFIGVTQDVSDRIRSERKLRHRNQELKRSNAELESFNRVASHDLQEPLRKIQMFISRIGDIDQVSEKSRDYFTKINLAANRMQVLINNLLTYSRIDNATDKIEEVDLGQVLDEITDSFYVRIKETGLKITHDPLPNIRAIPFQMEQLLGNLISNSMKYRDPEQPPHVHISVKKVDRKEIEVKFPMVSSSYFHLKFSDNGIGFDQANAHKVFEIFQRLHPKSHLKGTGIGLAICKKIVENHQGHIYATSAVGKGSSFHVYLPA